MDELREKLITMIQEAVGGCARHWAEKIADYLIVHGVTVVTASQKELCLKCQFAGRPPYKSPCSECRDYSNFEKKTKEEGLKNLVGWIPKAVDSRDKQKEGSKHGTGTGL